GDVKMKFAKSKYSSFDNSVLGLKLSKGDVFAVTSEIEGSAVYQTGISTKNFVLVNVGSLFHLEKVVNLTDELRAEFRNAVTTVIVEPVTEVPAPVEEQITIIHGPEVEDIKEVETPILPDVDSMNYKPLQNYAKELEKKFKIEINRGAKKADLLKEVKSVIDKYMK
ncbi:MAG: hypothetical protein ACTSVR_04675, partial [Candidatus Thorarchaeota archaeon]